MSRKRVSNSEANRISELESRFGSRTLRTLLTGEDQRLMRPERLANIQSGRGLLSDKEREQITLVSANAQQLAQLQTKGDSRGKVDWKSNRAMRDWVSHGKQRGADRRTDRNRELKAIKSLRFFGINPAGGGGYVRKAAK